MTITKHEQLDLSIKQLTEARELIHKALLPLETRVTKCECCGGKRRINFEEYQLWYNLKSIPQRLTDVAFKIEVMILERENRQTK